MKYIVFASMLSLLSMNTFALGQNSSSDIDCCSTGKCGNGLKPCFKPRDGLKREQTSTKAQTSKGKSSNGTGQ